MRAFVLLVVALFGCEYNYYGAVADGGVTDMPGYTDELGEYHETEPNQGIFKYDSKLQGHGDLVLAAPPARLVVPPALTPWPQVRQDPPAMALGQTLVDVMTKDGRPHVITMAIGLSGDVPVGMGGPFAETVAVIELGIGGIAYYVEVDAIAGTQFSMAVTHMSAHLIYRVVPEGNPGAPPPSLVGYTRSVGASVSSGVVAHGRQPQRTLAHGGTDALLGNLDPAYRADYWAIPTFAKSFRVVANPSTAQLRIRMFPSTFTGVNMAEYVSVAPAGADYPVPNDAYWLRVDNVDNNVVTNYRLVFELAL